MEFIISASTDAGLVKKNNQDSLMAKELSIDGEKVTLAVLCDGVGGLSKGEIASATVVHAFDRWFMERFPSIFHAENRYDLICADWARLLNTYNQKIRDYGSANGITLGTTVTAALMMLDRYYVVNVGDSRTYLIDDALYQITKDQTIVNYELEKGMITPEQAEKDTRNNILLQCVGASEQLVPDFFSGELRADTAFLLCSDGFRHVITEAEIYERFRPSELVDAEVIRARQLELIEINKSRMEKDNISVIVIKAY